MLVVLVVMVTPLRMCGAAQDFLGEAQTTTVQQAASQLQQVLDQLRDTLLALLWILEGKPMYGGGTLSQEEATCVANSIRGPWDNVGWLGDMPGCDDPTPWIQKMFWAPIQGQGALVQEESGSVTADISVSPSSLGSPGTVGVVWTSTHADSCSVVGTNGDSWSATTGSETSGLLTTSTTFTVTCSASGAADASDTATVTFSGPGGGGGPF